MSEMFTGVIMPIFIISNNQYLRDGIICVGQYNAMEIKSCQCDDPQLDRLNYEDIVILHLSLENKCNASKLSSLNQRCKVLLILSSSQHALICDADTVINAKAPPEVIMKALRCLIRRVKCKPTKNQRLSKIEKIILNKSLEGKDTHVIAESLSLTSKIVSNYRYVACRKIGAGKLTDLLIIKDHLKDDYAR